MSDDAVELRPIPDWPGYFATSDGRIVSFRSSRVVPRAGRTSIVVDDGRELATFDRKGKGGRPTYYLSVCLVRDGRRVNCYVHHLVAAAFLGPRPDGAEVCHGERGSHCNAASNLTYKTRAANLAERHHPAGPAWHHAREISERERARLDEDADPLNYEGAFDSLLGAGE